MKITKILLNNIPWLFIAVLMFIIFFKDCGGGRGSKVTTDTVTVTKIDTVYQQVKGSAISKPKVITITDTINHYITHNKICDRPHLNDKGIDLIKYRNYKDTVSIKGYFVSYDMSVIGELQGIKLFLNGNTPTIRQSTVKTVTNTIQKNNSLGITANYNRSLQLGLEYKNNNLSYGLNYDLDYQSLGVKIGYHPFKW